MASFFLHQGDASLRHAGGFIKALGGLDHGADHGLIFVAREEIDLVVGEAGEIVDLAVLGKLLGALGELAGVRRAPVVLHAGISGLRGVLPHHDGPIGEELAGGGLGTGEGPAGDDAGADDVLGVGDLDLPGHIGA